MREARLQPHQTLGHLRFTLPKRFVDYIFKSFLKISWQVEMFIAIRKVPGLRVLGPTGPFDEGGLESID